MENKSNSEKSLNLEKIQNDIDLLMKQNKKLEKELKEQNEIIDSYYDILNIIISNKFIKANGTLRNLQLVTLEMLKFIDNICKKYNLQYWLTFGTLLGAVRHEGFIPWDDEVDLAMPRIDYEKFIEVLPDEVNRFEELKNKLTIRKGSTVFKNAELSENSLTPVLQLIYRRLYAGLEVYPMDYIFIENNDPKELVEVQNKVSKLKKVFKNDYSNNLVSFEDGINRGNEIAGITLEKQDFLICSLDGANVKPIHTSNVFPLKKTKFEDCEFYIPNNPINYLATYYSGNIMYIPKKIHRHYFIENIEKTGTKDELELIYKEIFEIWNEINNSF